MSSTTNKDSDTLCGIGRFRPDCLQCFSSVAMFTVFFSPAALITQALNVYIASQLTTIEKFFGLSSAQSGFIMGCNDIGFLTMILVASYFARRIHIPRAMACATICYGISAYFCVLAYLFTPEEDMPIFERINSTTKDKGLCAIEVTGNKSREATCDRAKVGSSSEYTNIALALIAIGMILQGCGKAPRQPYVATYLDDNAANKQHTSRFLGIITCIGIIGPSMGFILGGVFSRIYVTLEDVPIGYKDPRWIGAWWLGFIVFGSLAILIAIPLICFPKYIHRRNNNKRNKIRNNSRNNSRGLLQNLKGNALRRLFTNPRYIGIMLTTTSAIFVVAGLQAYQTKYLQTQFGLPTWKSNILMGLLTTLAASLGSLTGGLLTSFLKFTPLQCIKYLTGVHFICTFPVIGQMFIRCSTPYIIGFNADSDQYNGTLSAYVTNLTTPLSCFDNCQCRDDYSPVCGSNGLIYMSPCHAGCSSTIKNEYGSIKDYQNCTCVGPEGTATNGLCESECSLLWLYLLLMFVTSYLRATTIVPSMIFKMRSVLDKDKSICLGISGFFHALFAWFAAPLVIGMLIDTCCLIWNEGCSGRGSCALYDNESFRHVRHLVEIVAKCITFTIGFVTYLLSRNRTDWSTEPHRKQEKITPEEDTLMDKPLKKNDQFITVTNIN